MMNASIAIVERGLQPSEVVQRTFVFFASLAPGWALVAALHLKRAYHAILGLGQVQSAQPQMTNVSIVTLERGLRLLVHPQC